MRQFDTKISLSITLKILQILFVVQKIFFRGICFVVSIDWDQI